MAVERIANLWNSVKGLVISQYKNATSLLQIVEKTVNSFQSAEDASEKISSFCNIDNAEGNWLDLIGNLKNVYRNAGESDADYRDRIKYEISVNYAGTARFMIEMSRRASGDPAPILHEEQAGSQVVFIYTPNGRQLTRGFVNSIAPAGVLGVPAARLMTATGKRIVNGRGKLFPLLTDDGRPLLTEDGRQLLVNLHKAKQILCVANDRNIGKVAQPSE